MKAAVKDANILIDLAEADLLGLWFKLDIETHTTDLVLNEIQEPSQRQKVMGFVDAGLLKVATLGPAKLRLSAAWSKKMNVSLPDASAYQLAQTLNAILLSGDRTLRNAATKSGVEVRGVLWVLDSLVQKKLLPAVEAAARLHRLMTGQSFLPPAECAKRLGRWEGKDSR